MKLKVLGIVIAIALSTTIKMPFAYANGVDFEQWCGRQGTAFNQHSCDLFVLGEVSGIIISRHMQVCFPANFDPRQALPIVQHWMWNHPQSLNHSEPVVIGEALRDAYPCN